VVFTSSYHEKHQRDFITNLVACIDPVVALEIGTQQGNSAIAIARGMRSGILYTCDLFEETYRVEPHGPTHANYAVTVQNLMKADLKVPVEVIVGNHSVGMKTAMDRGDIDLVHIDVCNHLTSVAVILGDLLAANQPTKCVLLEGGIHNKWQKTCGFDSYRPFLESQEISSRWTWSTIPFNSHNAITVMTSRQWLEQLEKEP
jgi:hypothetical protein